MMIHQKSMIGKLIAIPMKNHVRTKTKLSKKTTPKLVISLISLVCEYDAYDYANAE